MNSKLIAGLIAIALTGTFSSCKKCYVCTSGGYSTGSICKDNVPNNEDIETWKTRLEQQGYVCKSDD